MWGNLSDLIRERNMQKLLKALAILTTASEVYNSKYNMPFQNSKDKMYRRMFENMEANPAVFVRSNDEGVKRVESGKSKYAFFMESTSIEYELRKNCDLKKIGGELDSKDYGIAMPTSTHFKPFTNID